MTPDCWVAARGGRTAAAAAAGGAVPLLPRAMGVAGHGDSSLARPAAAAGGKRSGYGLVVYLISLPDPAGVVTNLAGALLGGLPLQYASTISYY